MSDNSTAPTGERRRKRVRKGTRSCWECKRRKIKCIYESEDHSTCVGCLDRGTNCLSQEYVDEQPPRETGSSALDQRMGRVEMLLEKMMEKVMQSSDDTHSPPSGPVDGVANSSTPASMYDSRPQFVSSLLDDDFGQQTDANASMPTPQSVHAPNSSGFTTSARGGFHGRLAKLQRDLAALLPCQEDVDYLSDSSHGWWLIQQHMLSPLLRVPESELRERFDVSTVSASHPMIIARLLLCVALCIQQLPPNVDLPRLQTKVPLREMMQKNIDIVTKEVISDDELTGSMEGVECFALQGLYQVIAGNLRRSWLAFRKAINVAQLLGIHRISLRTSQEAPDLTEARRHNMWFQLIREERYLSLILGVPSATGSTPFPFDDNAPWLTSEDLYHKHLCQISGLILARNQGDATHAFSTTQEIDEKLDALAKQMPQTWWDIPTSLMNDRTTEASAQIERTMCQIWHYELHQLVHLPFMLRTSTDRRYEYSRISCLSASRGLIMRWMFMRSAYSKTVLSSLIEFQAFTAAITILLGLLGPIHNTTDPVTLKERQDDLKLVETVAQILEGIKQYGCGVNVVNQSISIIHTLLGMARGETDSPGVLRLVIPHFGTISVARGGAVQSLEGERILGANPRSQLTQVQTPLQALPTKSTPSSSGTTTPWPANPVPQTQEYQSINNGGNVLNDNGMGMQNNVLQFTSSQFPTFDQQAMNNTAGWPFQENEMMFFDSLLNNDVAGNWNF
ncbi:hypothetical protein N431DRAFT_391419 [Stipitochalara longipes BDJ]|nr:hypothetical protein N431DRAFT_391419 [Stipitochalara longipes BDJ]